MSSIKVNNRYVVKLTVLLQEPMPIFMQDNLWEFHRFKVSEMIVRVGKEEGGR